MKCQLSVKDVSVVIHGTQLLKHVILELYPGKIYGIVGRNGSGKTVLLKAMCGFYPCSEGSIVSDGKVIGKDMDYLDDCGFIIENPGFLPGKTGYENLRYIAGINRIAGKERVRECLELVGLAHETKKPVRKYSLGMRQRLGLAQAVMEDPGLLILDEPMNGLDNEGVAKMRQLFLRLKEQGKCVLIVSHNREDIQLLCDEVYGMDSGVLTRLWEV